MDSDELALAFQGSVDPPPVSLPYKVGLLLVTFTMVLLPLFYVALIVLASYGVHYHAVNHTGILDGSGFLLSRMVAYLAPIVAGSVLVLFLIKPLFARSIEPDVPQSLVPTDEPELFAFVRKLCSIVKAPHPVRIDIDNDVNASAAFRNRTGGGLVLTLGLPLVAGLSLKQFAGVLAHELGHFSQGAGMRLTQIIRGVNLWFARVVFERDQWDEKVDEWKGSAFWAISLTALMSSLFVAISRWVLRLLMIAGNTISAYMMRQMELDADTYEVIIVGTETFAATIYRSRVLSQAIDEVGYDVAQSWMEGCLPENLPAFVATKADSAPPGIKEQIEKSIRERETERFDSHPSDRERIEHVQKLAHPGIFNSDEAAGSLFRDFDAVCREVTWSVYQYHFEENVQERHLISTQRMVERQERKRVSVQIAVGYFQLDIDGRCPFFFETDSIRPGFETGLSAERVRRSRKIYEEALSEGSEGYGRYLEGIAKESAAFVAKCVVGASVPYDPEYFGLTLPGENGVKRLREEGETLKDVHQASFDRIRRSTIERLATSLEALRDSKIVASVRGVPSLHEIEFWLRTLSILESVFPFANRIESVMEAINELFDRSEGQEQNTDLAYEFNRLAEQIQPALTKVRKSIGSARYPFEHVVRDVKLVDVLLEGGSLDEFDTITAAARKFLDGYFGLYFRIMRRLAELGVRVEESVGLSPMERPPVTPNE